MIDDEVFDLFLAYYGDAKLGSESAAADLYRSLQGIEIGRGRALNVYFHPVTNPHGSFEETPLIVARTPMFLLTVDRGIPRNDHGQLARVREDGSLRNLFEEVRSFHDSPMYKNGGDSSAKVFISDELSFRAAERLHPMFSGRTALRRADEAIRWIRDFYLTEYPERRYQQFVYLLKNDRQEFLDGRWTSDAESIWARTRHQGVGRTLLACYTLRIRNGDRSVRPRAAELCREISALRGLEDKTRNILSAAAQALNL